MKRAAIALLLSIPLAGEVRPSKLSVRCIGPLASATLLIENGNDNTANLEASFEVLSGSRVIAHEEKSAAAPPLLTSAIEAELRIPEGEQRAWDSDQPFLYTLRARMQKHTEAVEGGYDRELVVTFAELSPELRNAKLFAAADVDLAPEHLRLLREAGISVLVQPGASGAVRDWATSNGLAVVDEAPVGFETIRRFVPDFTSPDGHPTDAYRKFREANAPAVLRTITEVNGVTRIEVEARLPLSGYAVRVGNQEQLLGNLKLGERVVLEFPSVNPYRVEVRSKGGFIVADR